MCRFIVVFCWLVYILLTYASFCLFAQTRRPLFVHLSNLDSFEESQLFLLLVNLSSLPTMLLFHLTKQTLHTIIANLPMPMCIHATLVCTQSPSSALPPTHRGCPPTGSPSWQVANQTRPPPRPSKMKTATWVSWPEPTQSSVEGGISGTGKEIREIKETNEK
jgi:hypothetical protein